MQTRTILRLAYLVVALALLMWISVGGITWSVWKKHQTDVAATASALTAGDPLAGVEPFDRAKSSVQYARLKADGDPATVPPWLTREIGPLSAGEQTMAGWVAELREEGLQVCLEQCRRQWQDADPAFEINRERVSVREVLDELCRGDSRYYWEWMAGSEVVNVVPAGRLEMPLGDVSFRRKNLMQCQADIEPYLVSSPYTQGKPTDEMQDWPFSMRAKQITVRDYLNLLVKQHEGMTWTVNFFGHVGFDAPEATRKKMRSQ